MSTDWLGKVPEDIEAERSLLATICAEGFHREMDEILAILTPAHFVHPSHVALFESFVRLHVSRQDINPLAFKADMEAHKTLNKVRGYVGILEILEAPEVGKPLVLAELLHDRWSRRQIQKVSAKIVREVVDTSIPIPELFSEVKDLEQISSISPILTVCGAGEFLDTPAPEASWLIPGLIPLGVPAVMAAKGGMGKSMISLQMCITLATGKAFFTFDAQPPMGAIYFGLEDSKEIFHARLRSIVDHYKACDDWSYEDDQNLRFNFSAPFINYAAKNASPYLPLILPNLESILKRNSIQGVSPGVIILDTLSRISEGDENTVQAIRPILNACHALAGHGYTPIALHHVAKGQDGARAAGSAKSSRPKLADRMSVDYVRGSSAIGDNFRCVTQLTPLLEHEAEGIGLDPDKARAGGYLIFGATKLNGGMKADWIFIEQDEHGRWFAPQSGMETLAKLRGGQALAAHSKQMAVLGSIHEARFAPDVDRAALAAQHFSDSADPANALRQLLMRLRRAGLIQQGKRTDPLRLTFKGINAITNIISRDVEPIEFYSEMPILSISFYFVTRGI